MEIINFDKDSKLVLETHTDGIEININKCRVIISDLADCKKTITVNDGSLDYCFIKKNQKEMAKIVVNKGEVDIRVIDIFNNESESDYCLDLNEENSEVNFSVASIAREQINKSYTIRSNNLAKNTKIKLDCFGISENKSTIKYDVTSFIKNGAKGAIVNQNSKILLFDKESKGINNPVLLIEENDVKANHGSSIGMIDEETLFYLTSRGIKESDARNLVSLGKINYLIERVNDEKIKNDLLKEILERV